MTKPIIAHLFAILLILILSGCATPGQLARAHRINTKTQEEHEWHDLRLSEAKATAPDRVQASRVLLWTVVSLLIGFGLVSLVSYGTFAIGKAQAEVMAAKLRAGLVPMDPTTHHYPVNYFPVKGRLYFHNPNTGEVKKMGQIAQPHPQLTAGSHQAQLASITRQVPQPQKDEEHLSLPQLIVEGDYS